MKIFTGKVTGIKTAKTATVSVERMVIHPLYKKRFKRDKKYQTQWEKVIDPTATVEKYAIQIIP